MVNYYSVSSYVTNVGNVEPLGNVIKASVTAIPPLKAEH